ncbi:MAG: hypothetical protein ACI4VQ_01040 [Clostridia bacterium]
MLNLKQKINQNKRIFIIIAVLLIILLIIFLINYYKNRNIGNNTINKTLEEVEDYILNIKSYQSTIEVTVNSNKNSNKYILKQTHTENGAEYEDIQEVIEPENIKGTTLAYKNGTLEIKNTNLNLTKIYNDYPYIEDNNLWLNSFIKEYKEASNKNKQISETNGEIILTLSIYNNDKFKYKELYLDKKTGNPTKLLIKNANKKEVVYILYTEIELQH